MEPVPAGQPGLTVVTNLNSEGSPQLRFVVGDFTTLDYDRVRVRAHVGARSRRLSSGAPTTC